MLVVDGKSQEPGLVSLETTKRNAKLVTHGLDLAPQRGLTATPRVVTEPMVQAQIMD